MINTDKPSSKKFTDVIFGATPIADPTEESSANAINIGVDYDVSDQSSIRKTCLDLAVVGAEGSGKTSTCIKTIIDSGKNFLIIAPSKTEYRTLKPLLEGCDERGLSYYTLGREDLSVFRLNPFEVLHKGIPLRTHICDLVNLLESVFPMTDAMRLLLEEAMSFTYRKFGWLVDANFNYLVSDPWNTDRQVWPTITDFIEMIRFVVRSKGNGSDFENEYENLVIAHLTTLTIGEIGKTLNTRHSVDFEAMLHSRVIIELEEIKDTKHKLFVMLLLYIRLLYSSQKCSSIESVHKKHLTLIDDINQLLSEKLLDDDRTTYRAKVLFWGISLCLRESEESLIIATQSPNDIFLEISRKPRVTISHRLDSAKDLSFIDDFMKLSDDQKKHVPYLDPGHAIVCMSGQTPTLHVTSDQYILPQDHHLSEQELYKLGAAQFRLEIPRLSPRLSSILVSYDPDKVMQIYQLATGIFSDAVNYTRFARGDLIGSDEQKAVFRRTQDRVNQLVAACEKDLNWVLEAIVAAGQDLGPEGLKDRFFYDYMKQFF